MPGLTTPDSGMRNVVEAPIDTNIDTNTPAPIVNEW